MFFLLSSENVGLPPVKIVWNKSFNSQLSSLIALKDRCALSVNDINGSIGEVHLTWFAVTQDLRFLLPFAFDGLQPVGQATTLSIVIRPSPFFDHSAAAAGSSRLKIAVRTRTLGKITQTITCFEPKPTDLAWSYKSRILLADEQQWDSRFNSSRYR
jgi:hypothetical protein